MPSEYKPPPEYKPPEYKPFKKGLRTSISPGLIFGILRYTKEILPWVYVQPPRSWRFIFFLLCVVTCKGASRMRAGQGRGYISWGRACYVILDLYEASSGQKGYSKTLLFLRAVDVSSFAIDARLYNLEHSFFSYYIGMICTIHVTCFLSLEFGKINLFCNSSTTLCLCQMLSNLFIIF